MIVNFDAFLGQDADVCDVVLMAVPEFEKGLRVGELSDLDFIGALTNLPHMEFSMSLANARCPPFFAMLAGFNAITSRIW